MDMLTQLQDPQRWLLMASVALLVLAVPLKVWEARRQRSPAPQGQDLRWWKNREWSAAVYG